MIEFYNQTLIYNLILSVLILTSYLICLKVVNATEHSLIRMCHVIVTCQIVLEPMVRGSFFFCFFYFVNIIELLSSYEVNIESFHPLGGCFLERFPRNGNTLLMVTLESSTDWH